MAWAIVTEGDRHKPRFLYFLAADWDGMSGSSWDHGTFAGLLDDDHTQYVLVDGSRSMTGTLTIENDSPAIHLTDTGYGSDFWDIIHTDGTLIFRPYDTATSSYTYPQILFNDGDEVGFYWGSGGAVNVYSDVPTINLVDATYTSNYWTMYEDGSDNFRLDHLSGATRVIMFVCTSTVFQTQISNHQFGSAQGSGYVGIKLGQGRTTSGTDMGCYIDMIGDTTYLDYATRYIRYYGGANASSQIVHRGAGWFYLTASDSGYIQLGSTTTKRLHLIASGGIRVDDDPAVFSLYDTTATDTYQFYTGSTAFTIAHKDGPTSSWTYLIGFQDSDGGLRTAATSCLKEDLSNKSSNYIVTQKGLNTAIYEDYSHGWDQFVYLSLSSATSFNILTGGDTFYDEICIRIWGMKAVGSTTPVLQLESASGWAVSGYAGQALVIGYTALNFSTAFYVGIPAWCGSNYTWYHEIRLRRFMQLSQGWFFQNLAFTNTATYAISQCGGNIYLPGDLTGVRLVQYTAGGSWDGGSFWAGGRKGNQ